MEVFDMYDEAVLKCFLDNQLQLFPETVVETLEEAEDFLGECFAVVCNSASEVWDYFEDEGIDMEGLNKGNITDAEEVFEVGDGRYLIVEC